MAAVACAGRSDYEAALEELGKPWVSSMTEQYDPGLTHMRLTEALAGNWPGLKVDAALVLCKDRVQYIMGLALTARYWHPDRAEQLEWLLHVLRNELPIGKLKLTRCDRCGHDKGDVHEVHGIAVCRDCIREFIAAKTMIVRHELPGPTPA